MNQADLLRRRLKTSSDTIAAIAQRMGVSETTLRNLEKGRSVALQKRNWRPFADALGIAEQVVVDAATDAATDPWPEGEPSVTELPPAAGSIPFVIVPADGDRVRDDDETQRAAALPGVDADFAAKVEGECMIPVLGPGSIVWLKLVERPADAVGKIVFVETVDGARTLKRLDGVDGKGRGEKLRLSCDNHEAASPSPVATSKLRRLAVVVWKAAPIREER